MTTKLTKVDVPKVGPKPDGSPAAMLQLASRCRTLAGDFLTGCSDATSAIDPGTMNFTGRKATWIRGSVDRNSKHALRVAHQMQSFAKNLEAGAADLQTELKAYDKQVAAAADAVAHNAKVDAQTNPLGVPSLPGLIH